MQRNSPLRTVFQRLATAAVLLCVSTAASQQKVEDGATIHVYANLLQIPVLILSGKHQALPPIEPGKFLVRVGDFPPFHPKVRLEGEDPVTLAVLIDGTFDGPMLPQLSDSLAAMARDHLHRQDRIALYGMDGCKLRRTSPLAAPNATLVQTAVQAIEAFPPYEHHWHGPKCDTPTGLWDAVSWVSKSLQGEPGRRVVLVITNGIDAGSRLGADETRLIATRNGVAVFAVAERFKVRTGNVSSPGVSVVGNITSALAYIAEGSGGMVMETTRNNVAGTLARFPQLLRERYILEFSRPAGMAAGSHFLTVSVGQPKDFIRPAGTSMPVADPEAPDPSVEHGKLSDNPPLEEPAQDTGSPGGSPDGIVPAPSTGIPIRDRAADPTDITNDTHPAATNPGRP